MNWYYLDNGAQRGPITEAEFPTLFQIGTLRPETYLWCEGMPEWKPYSELLAAAPAPAASPAAVAQAGPTGAPMPASGLRVRQEELQPETERTRGCSQCGTPVPVSQMLQVGSAALCPKCQIGYKRQAHLGFGSEPADYANPFVRLGAYILDTILVNVVILALTFGAMLLVAFFFSGKATTVRAFGIGLQIVAFLWVLDYYVGRIAREGATPMMKLFHLRVVTSQGSGLGGWRALARFLMMMAVTILTLGLGHLVAFFDKQRRSLHDIVCGTIVIKR